MYELTTTGSYQKKIRVFSLVDSDNHNCLSLPNFTFDKLSSELPSNTNSGHDLY